MATKHGRTEYTRPLCSWIRKSAEEVWYHAQVSVSDEYDESGVMANLIDKADRELLQFMFIY